MSTMSQSANMSSKFEKISRDIDDSIKRMLKKLNDLIKLEIDFKPVRNVYSPINDWGEKKSFESRMLFEEKLKLLMLEKEKLQNIGKKLNEKKINVALFGDVSAGKSQTINCILDRRLFVPAYCHTTSCFVRINLAPDGQPESVSIPDKEIMTCNSEEVLRDTIVEYANQNGTKTLKPDQIIQLLINKKDGDKIMSDMVTLTDCPGGNKSPEVTDLIEKVVVEADVFLYILTQVIFEQQRLFFKQLLTKTSTPNIFVLVNKWDETDDDDPNDTERARDSLVKEITKWLTDVDADNTSICNERIFFISANETLNKKTGTFTSDPSAQQQKRLEDFERFERIFKGYLDNPRMIKEDKHTKELSNMEGNIRKIEVECDGDFEKLSGMREVCRKTLEKTMAEVDKVAGNLESESEKQIKETNPKDYDKFYKEYLKVIEKAMGQFIVSSTKVSEQKSTLGWLWSGVQKSAKFVSNSILTGAELTEKNQTMDKVKAYIDQEVNIIKSELDKEIKCYDQYIKEVNDIYPKPNIPGSN